jgi:hypothetical protein
MSDKPSFLIERVPRMISDTAVRRGHRYSAFSIYLMQRMQAVRGQGQDARECSGADGNHQQQTDAGKGRRMKEEVRRWIKKSSRA